MGQPGLAALPAHASFSSFSSYLQCGERYRLERVAQVPQTPAWYFVGGSAVHTATEMLDSGQTLSAEEAFSIAFERELAERKEATDIPEDDWSAGGKASKKYPRREDRQWWLDNGPAMVQAWLDWRERCGWQIWQVPDTDTPAVELSLNIILGDMPVKMFIDRIFLTRDGQLVVVDIKSGATEPDSVTQLGLYACGLEKVFGVRPQLGAYWMARKHNLGQVTDLEHLTPGVLGKWIHDWDRARKAGIFIPHPTRLCRICGVRDYCAAVGGRKAGQA